MVMKLPKELIINIDSFIMKDRLMSSPLAVLVKAQPTYNDIVCDTVPLNGRWGIMKATNFTMARDEILGIWHRNDLLINKGRSSYNSVLSQLQIESCLHYFSRMPLRERLDWLMNNVTYVVNLARA